jgi:pimeloyl-ACP methyl ester carboxylesterase
MTQVLGYSRYVAQAGDWGAYAASRLGYLFPDAVHGIYLSYVVGGLIPFLDEDGFSQPPLARPGFLYRGPFSRSRFAVASHCAIFSLFAA